MLVPSMARGRVLGRWWNKDCYPMVMLCDVYVMLSRDEQAQRCECRNNYSVHLGIPPYSISINTIRK